MKRLLTVLAAGMAALLVAGCGSSDGSKADKGNASPAETYTAHVNMKNAESVIPQENGITLFPGAGTMLVYQQDQFIIDYELEINGSDYVLTTTCYTADPNDNDKPHTVGDGSTIAAEIVSVASGTVAEKTDTSISLNTAKKVTYTIDEKKQDSITKEQLLHMFSMAAPDAETLCGEWTSDEFPELLDAYPAATITVEGTTITNIK